MNKIQAKKLFEALNLNDEWKYSTDGYGYEINHKSLPHNLRFAGRNNFGVTRVRCGINIYFPYLSYIINKICPEFDHPTDFTIIEDFDKLFNNENEYFEFSLPIWEQQWLKIKPYLLKYNSHEKLYQAELDSIKNDKNPIWYGSSFFGLSYNIKSLILSKLISDSIYIERKEIYFKLIDKPPYDEEDADRRSTIGKLITYLDSLDKKKYLSEQPWKNSAIKVAASNPIELKRISMVVLSNSFSLNEISILCGADSINKLNTFTAAESAIMSFSNEEELHILQLKPTMISFIQNPLVYEAIDLKKSTGEAIKFVIDEGASDSVRIDYYKNGVEQFSYLYSMGEELESLKHKDFDLNIDDPRVVIDTLFERISGRRLDEIMEDEEGCVYRFK